MPPTLPRLPYISPRPTAQIEGGYSPPRRGGVDAPSEAKAQTGWSDRRNISAELTTPALCATSPLRGGECVCLPSRLNRSFHQIHDALFGIENSHPPGIAFDLFQPLRIPNQLKNRRGKAFSLEFGVGYQDRCILFRHGARIFHLVIVCSERKRNQNRGTSSGFDLGHGCGARP